MTVGELFEKLELLLYDYADSEVVYVLGDGFENTQQGTRINNVLINLKTKEVELCEK